MNGLLKIFVEHVLSLQKHILLIRCEQLCCSVKVLVTVEYAL